MKPYEVVRDSGKRQNSTPPNVRPTSSTPIRPKTSLETPHQYMNNASMKPSKTPHARTNDGEYMATRDPRDSFPNEQICRLADRLISARNEHCLVSGPNFLAQNRAHIHIRPTRGQSLRGAAFVSALLPSNESRLHSYQGLGFHHDPQSIEQG